MPVPSNELSAMVDHADNKPIVVVLGGSGYLGLHILHSLCQQRKYQLAFTYYSHPPPLHPFPDVRAYHVDLQSSGQGLDLIAKDLGCPFVVINCAAVSIPRDCESNPAMAMAVNRPVMVVQWLSSFSNTHPPLLIHLSTDQVYAGTKSFYKEDDVPKPVNVYGRSKLEGETFIRKNWLNYVILRSSIIYGPQPIVNINKLLPIQRIDQMLSSGKGAEFFHDEYRCPIFVRDVVHVVELLINRATGTKFQQMLLNMGGPERLSRADMAHVVADVKDYDQALVKEVSAASVSRDVVSPADISMDVSRITSLLAIELTGFSEGVKLTLNN